MKSLLTTRWSFFRMIRLLMGVLVIVQGVNASETVLIVAGVMVSVMALVNVGCCGSAGCSLPQSQKQKTIQEKISYEEVVK